MNSASNAFSKGIAQDSVNRVRQIKKDMYGWTGIDIPRN